MNLSIIKTNGFRLIILTLIIFYLPSYFFCYFYQDAFNEAFYGFEDGFFYSVLYIFIIIGLVILLNWVVPKINLLSFFNYLCPFRYRYVNNTLAVFYLLFSFKFFYQYGLSFVHSGTSMADVESYVMILYGLKGYFLSYLFFIYVRIINYQSFKFDFFYVIILISELLSLSGAMDVVHIFLFLTPIFLNAHNLKKMFIKQISFFKIKNILLVFLFFIIGLLTIFIGYANKLGVENTFKLVQNFEELEYLYVATLIRFANGFASFVSLSNSHFFDYQLQLQAISIPFEVFKYRLCVLGNIIASKPEVFNVARLNYLTVYKDYHPTAGATPGLLGSIFYIPIFPLNFIIISLYVLFIIKQVNRFFSTNVNRLNIIGLLLVFVFILPLFESPLDYLIIIDPSVLSLLYFITLSSYFNNRSHEKSQFSKINS